MIFETQLSEHPDNIRYLVSLYQHRTEQKLSTGKIRSKNKQHQRNYEDGHDRITDNFQDGDLS